jgi:hypothetical protein
VVKQLRLEQALGNSVADLTSSADRSRVYTLAARALGADAANIALTDSHTTGWAKALQTISLNAGDVILTSRSEWGPDGHPNSPTYGHLKLPHLN